MIGECQKQGLIRKDVSAAQAIVTTMFGVAPRPLKTLVKKELISLESLHARIDVVIKGLKACRT